MTFWLKFLQHALLASLVTLFLAVILESIFPYFMTQRVSFDRLLWIAMLLGIGWGILTWHRQHFQTKSQSHP